MHDIIKEVVHNQEHVFKPWGDRSIRTKLILGFAFVSGVAIVLIGGVSYWNAKENLVHQTQSSLVSITEVKSGHLLEYFLGLEARMQIVASNPLVRGILMDDGSRTNESMNEVLAEYTQNPLCPVQKSMVDINVMDTTGVVVASTFSAHVGEELYGLSEQEYQWIASGGWPHTQNIQALPTSMGERSTFVITAPVQEEDAGTHIGFVSGVIDSDCLTELIGNQSLATAESVLISPQWRSLEMMIVDRSGDVIAPRSDRDQIVDLEEISHCQQGYRGGVYEDDEGIRRIGATKCFKADWFIVAQVPYATLQEALRQTRWAITMVGGLAFVFMTLLSLLPASAIIRPIRKLQEAAERVSQGDFSPRAAQDDGDQLGQLGRHFNLMVNELEKADQLKKEFISIVSHQLRTPLTSIRLYTDLLSDTVEDKTDEQHEYVEAIETSVTRMLKLVTDLLNLSRLEGGRLKINPTSTDISQLVIDEVKAVEALAAEKKAKLVVKKPSEPVVADADTQLLRQIVHNLLTNAIKYGPEQFGTVEVDLERVGDNGEEWIQISVSDQGMGMDPDEQAVVFQKFVRGKSAQKQSANGTGIGLYIAKMILDQSGGEIELESTVGQGSIFRIRIPKTGMQQVKRDTMNDV